MEKIVRKLIELNKIYRELPQDNYSYWEFNNNSRDSRESFARRVKRDHAVPAYADRETAACADRVTAPNGESFTLLKNIGRGAYIPQESQIRKYDLARHCFLVELWEQTAYLSVTPFVETQITDYSMNIWTDETVLLGANLQLLKELLEIEPQETDFEIFRVDNSQILIKSYATSSETLILQIGSYKLTFRYYLNYLGEIVLAYCGQFNNTRFCEFKGVDPTLKTLNNKCIFPCIKHFKLLLARTTFSEIKAIKDVRKHDSSKIRSQRVKTKQKLRQVTPKCDQRKLALRDRASAARSSRVIVPFAKKRTIGLYE